MPALLADLDLLPVVEVPISWLLPGLSPRLAGEDERNVRLLTEVSAPLPPLLVHRSTHRVIDGMHRLLAARRRGEEKIAVRLYDCDDADLFVLAVDANVAHGLPLTLNDRAAAADRILETHPGWSDRRIAAKVGLPDRAVGSIRSRRAPRTRFSPRVATEPPAEWEAAKAVAHEHVGDVVGTHTAVEQCSSAQPVPADDGEPPAPAMMERALLVLLAQGLTDDAAAKRLCVSVRTERRMVADLLRRLNAGSRFEAGVKATRLGWL
jgi:DNA-binding CsgD family transcriptional regulator